MKWAALITWVVTAGGGFVLLGIWLKNGGVQRAREAGRRIRPPLIFGHFALAAAGLVIWIIYLAVDKDVLTWIAFAILAVVAALGFTMFAIWLSQRRGVAAADAPEQRFPVSIVGLHGLLAATTLVLVLLTALKVGESS
jgi:hypothetical protein